MERVEDVDVRRNCLCAGDTDEGDDRFGEAEAVRMLVGEPARRLEGDDEVGDGEDARWVHFRFVRFGSIE